MVVGRRIAALPKAFGIGPTIIFAPLDDIYFFKLVAPYVAYGHSPRAGLQREGERIAQARSPNSAVISCGLGIKRVVGRNISFGRKPQYFS